MDQALPLQWSDASDNIDGSRIVQLTTGGGGFRVEIENGYSTGCDDLVDRLEAAVKREFRRYAREMRQTGEKFSAAEFGTVHVQRGRLGYHREESPRR